jgi:ribosomal protein S18 acetylase RimI-like enzyme
MLTIVQVETPDHVRAVRKLLVDYLSWATTLAAASGDAPTFQGLDDELAGLPGIYAPPAGRLLLAFLDGEPAGCVALMPHDPTSGELKRLYVDPAFRGHQIGWHLVEALLKQARAAGYRRVVLDSHISMKGAHSIYHAHGFADVKTPDDFPAALKPFVVFMECDLAIDRG